MRILFFITLAVVFFSSCEKDANIKLPSQEPKLAVSCFISPGDSIVKAYIYLSQPTFGAENTSSSITNAVVTISNGAAAIALLYNINTGAYEANLAAFPINYNTTYYLSVVDPAGRKATAQTTTPNPVNPTYDVSETSTTDPNGNINYQINCAIHDISGEENYYRVNAGNVYYDSTYTDTIVNIGQNSVFVMDKGKDGNTLNAGLEEHSGGAASPPGPQEYRAHRVVVIKCTKEYYNFNLSVITANISNGNPFAEPTIIYSNVDGGYGCFGAYTMTYKDNSY